MQIKVSEYPQLHSLCWNRPGDTILNGEEALGLYERNWRFVEKDKLTDDEKALIDTLVEKFGNGVFLA